MKKILIISFIVIILIGIISFGTYSIVRHRLQVPSYENHTDDVIR